METIVVHDDSDLLERVAELPVQVEVRGLIWNAFIAAISCIFLAVVLAGLLLSTPAADRRFVLYVMVPVIAVGLLALVRALLCHRCYTFTAEMVEYRSRGLVLRRRWQEPLSMYRGILSIQESASPFANQNMVGPPIPGRRRRGVEVTYALCLKHQERTSRDIVLFYSTSSDGLRARHEQYARLLGVPALTETADGVVERVAADFDKSVSERVAEGTLAAAFDPSKGPPGHGLIPHIQGDTLVLRSRASPVRMITEAVLVVAGVVAAMPPPIGIPALGPLPIWLAVVAGAGLLWHTQAREELEVSPREVCRRLLIAGRTLADSALPSSEIEEVLLASPPGAPYLRRVLAVSDKGTVSFGMMLSNAQRRWVRDCIIAVISK